MIKEILLIVTSFLLGSSIAFLLKGYSESEIETIRIILETLCERIPSEKYSSSEIQYVCKNPKTVAITLFFLLVVFSVLLQVSESSNQTFLIFIILISSFVGFASMYFYFLK
ncbi:MAG: hypothetical protein QXP34_03270 [Candidatus Aenigmatarchaeota archaeon]